MAIVKFAASDKVRTVHSFDAKQTREAVQHALAGIAISDGVTALNSAIQQVILI